MFYGLGLGFRILVGFRVGFIIERLKKVEIGFLKWMLKIEKKMKSWKLDSWKSSHC